MRTGNVLHGDVAHRHVDQSFADLDLSGGDGVELRVVHLHGLGLVLIGERRGSGEGKSGGEKCSSNRLHLHWYLLWGG
jgi:hypothetical protein